jgi:hypothetical protein
MRGRAFHAAGVVALICLFAVGCGSDDPGDQSSGTSLTAHQYAELERLYRAQVPLDRLVGSSDPDDMRRLLTGTKRSCQQVDKSDPLLAAVVHGCEELATNMAALGNLDCATPKECNELMASLTTTMQSMLDALRRSQPIIERDVSDEACRDALVIPEEREVLEEVVDALQRFDDAMRSDDIDELEAAGADVDETLKGFDDTPSAKEQLRDFRAACRSAGS